MGASVALAGGAVLAACGGNATNTAPASDRPPATIEYFTHLNARQTENYQALFVQPFQKAHPKITLNIIPWETGLTKLTVLLAGGTPPDATWIDRAVAEPWGGKLIREISDLVKRDKYNVGQFPRASFEGYCTWRGRVLSLPNQSGGSWPAMPYNRDLFQQTGATEPPAKWGDASWNAARWLTALQKTTRTGTTGAAGGAATGAGQAGGGTAPLSYGIGQIGGGVIYYSWSSLWKTAWLSDDYKTVTSDAPALVEAMEYLVSLTTRHKVMPTATQLKDAFGENSTQNAFLNGKLAMLQVSTGNIFTVATAVRDRNLPIVFAPLPSFKITGSSQGMESNGLPTGSRHPDEAWALVRWSAETPNWAISRGSAPPKVEHFEAWEKEVFGDLAARVRVDVLRDSLRNAAPPDRLTQLPSFSQMQKEVLDPALNKLWTGEVGVAATLKEIKPALQALVPKELPA